MYWNLRPHPENWINQIRYYCNYDNELTENELRDAFINLAYHHVMEFSNVKLLEEAIVKEFGKRGEAIIEQIATNSPAAEDLIEIGANDGDMRDIRGITLNMCDYIEDKWF